MVGKEIIRKTFAHFCKLFKTKISLGTKSNTNFREQKGKVVQCLVDFSTARKLGSHRGTEPIAKSHNRWFALQAPAVVCCLGIKTDIKYSSGRAQTLRTVTDAEAGRLNSSGFCM